MEVRSEYEVEKSEGELDLNMRIVLLRHGSFVNVALLTPVLSLTSQYVSLTAQR